MFRAILSPARIVLIDEATANVDQETDQQVQEVGDRIITTTPPRVPLKIIRKLKYENFNIIFPPFSLFNYTPLNWVKSINFRGILKCDTIL